jgi:YHS domain-containing protein
VVADRAPGEPTIALELDGKTYHVCCVRCEARLKEDASFRYSSDPVSGRPVDKAEAFIAVMQDGRAFYFESERTARIFDAILRAESNGVKVY